MEEIKLEERQRHCLERSIEFLIHLYISCFVYHSIGDDCNLEFLIKAPHIRDLGTVSPTDFL